MAALPAGGDGKFPDFEKTRSNEKLVWADKRKETIQKNR
jgi:hypothetical protein